MIARARRREESAMATLISEVFAGTARRQLPEPVARTLEALDNARRREPVSA
jgi:hypothetical protein